MTPPLPLPRDASLAGCVWLARFLAKARLLLGDRLPPDYFERFGQPDGVDGHFFRFFGLTHEHLMDVIRRDPLVDGIPRDPLGNAAFAGWFLALPGIDARRIAAWNAFAETLGRPGHPMAERLAAVLPEMSARLDVAKVHSIFDLITADETAPGLA